MIFWQWVTSVSVFAGILLLPGWLLSLPLPYRWYERLPMALVLGVGVLSPFAAALLQGQGNLHTLGVVSLAISLVAGIWHKDKLFVKWEGEQHVSNLGGIALGATILILIGLHQRFASTFSYGDHWFYLAYLRQFIDVGLSPELTVLQGVGAELANSTRAGLNGWWVIKALLVDWSGADLLLWFTFAMPAFLIPIAILAHLSLAKKLMGGINAGILATFLYIAFVAATVAHPSGIGRGFFTRIIEDKYLIWLVFLPVASRLLLDYLARYEKQYVFPLLLCTIAFALTHPLGLVQWGIILGGMVVMRLLWATTEQNNRALWVVVVGFGVLMLVPLGQRLILSANSDSLGKISGFLVNGATYQSRILAFSVADNHYISHPDLLAHPFILLSLLLTPFLFSDVRRKMPAQFLLVTSLLPLLLLYTPFLTPQVGKLIPPDLLWRILWLLPVTLTIAYFLHQRPPATIGLVLVLMGWLIFPGVCQSYAFLQDWREQHITPTEQGVLGALQTHLAGAETDVFVFAPANLSTRMPAFSAHTLAFHFRGKAANPLADIYHDQFYNSPLVTSELLDMLVGLEVDLLIVPTYKPIANQLVQLPDLFPLLYRNDEYLLLAMSDTIAVSLLTAGNSALAHGELVLAQSFYQQIPDHPLAQVGLADIAQLLVTGFAPPLRATSPLTTSIATLEQQIANNPLTQFDISVPYSPEGAEAVLLRQMVQLGDLYAKAGQSAEAITTYQRAIQYAPIAESGYEKLGNYYMQLGQENAGIQTFQRAVQANPRVAWSHVLLGKALAPSQNYHAILAFTNATKLFDGAPAAYLQLARYQYDPIPDLHQALNDQPFMSPVRLELASLERQAGNLAEAQALLQEGIRLEPNNSNFYMPLHFALLAGGQKEEAIALRDGLVQSFPYAAWAWDTAGMMAVSTADFGVAEIYFKRALGLNRTNANINYRLGNLYQHSLDDPQTTIPYYRYAIQLNAGSANYFTNLGTALFKTDQPEAGRAALQYALQLNPNSTTIQNLISEYD